MTQSENLNSNMESNGEPVEVLPRQSIKNMTTVINLEPSEIRKGKEYTSLQDTNFTVSETTERVKSPDKLQAERTGCKRFLGLSLGICASVAFSLAMLIVKLLADYDPSTVGVWRFSGILLPSLPIILFYRIGLKKPVFDPVWPPTEPAKLKMSFVLLLRGILGCTAIVLQYYSIRFIDLADSTVIAFSTPVFVSLLARIFLKEKCGVFPVITALLTFVGVVIIARPPLLTGEEEFNESNLIGTILSFTSMLFATLVFVILRYLREVHFALITTSFGFVGVIECIIACIIVGRFDLPNSAWDWFLAISLATLTFIGQSFMTTAFKFEQAGPVALTRTFDVVFAFIWQLIFLGVYPDAFSLLGSGIVILAVILSGLRTGLSSLPENSPMRKRYWFLLK